MKIFKKKSKNCKHIVRVSSFFASLAAFCCQRNYLLEILPIHCIQTLPRLFYFILKRTKLQSDKQFRCYRLQSVPTPAEFFVHFHFSTQAFFPAQKISIGDFANSLYPNIAQTISFHFKTNQFEITCIVQILQASECTHPPKFFLLFHFSTQAFFRQRKNLLEILLFHCIQTLPRLILFILKHTKLQSDVQFRCQRLQSIPTPLSFY